MVKNKQEFLELSQKGLLGNTLQIFNSLLEIPNWIEYIAIRNRQKDSPFFEPNITIKDAVLKIQEWIKLGLDPNTCYFQQITHGFNCPLKNNEMCHGCGRILNGQAMRYENYIDLIYGTHPFLNLRHDLDRFGKNIWGINAVNLIKKVGAYEELNELWDKHPEDVVEFTVFDRPVGTLRTNMITWEVRGY